MGRFFFVALIILGSIVFLLFFPIYLKTESHYDVHRRKLAFVMHINKFFRVLGGYIATYKGGFALHVSEKKAILLPYKEMNSKRKKISIIRTFRLKALSITTECGAQYFLQMAALQEVFEGIFLIFGGKKEKKVVINGKRELYNIVLYGTTLG